MSVVSFPSLFYHDSLSDRPSVERSQTTEDEEEPSDRERHDHLERDGQEV